MCSRIYRLKNIDSTHRLAVRMIEERNEDSCVIIAEHQTDGVGRCGRRWISSNDSLFMSMIMPLPNADVGQVSLTVACAVHDAILHHMSSTENKRYLFLHWPNDIYYKNKKMSGILLSVVSGKLVVSAGINVNSAPDLETAVCIKDVLGCNIDVNNMFGLVMTKIQEWIYSLEEGNFVRIKNYWLQHVCGINERIVIKNGREEISGIFVGLDQTGRLILNRNGQYLRISSGDMFLNEKNITVIYG